MAGYFIWRLRPEILSIDGFTLWWSAVLLVLGFLISRHLLLHFYKKESKPLDTASYLSVYLVLAALAGARLGHLILYEPGAIFSKALTIIFPFELKPDFRFLDAGEFSLHGAAFGVLIFLWVYSRKSRVQQGYFQLLDRVSVACMLAGVFLLLASFSGHEMTGKPTAASIGTVFVSPVQKGLMKIPCCIMRTPDGENPLAKVEVRKDPGLPKDEKVRKSLIFYLFFKPGASERLVNEFLIGDVKNFLYEISQFVHEPGDQPLHYRIFLEKDGNYIARIQTEGISRYPVQLLEAASCFCIFIFLWRYRSEMKHPGRVFGAAMVFFWTFHAGFWFLMEAQYPAQLVLNIVFVVIGVAALLLSYRRTLSAGSKGVSEKFVLKKD